MRGAALIHHRRRLWSAYFLEQLGIVLLILPASAMLVTSLKFHLGKHLEGSDLIPANVLALSLAAVSMKSGQGRSLFGLRTGLAMGAAVGGLLGFSVWISTRILEMSYDGLWYHQITTLLLTGRVGPPWNPFREPVFGPWHFFVESYPRWVATVSAQITLGQGSIEAGKAIQWIMLVSAAALLSGLLLRFTRIRPMWAGVLGILMAANPVTISQLSTQMVDGTLASLFLICACLSIRLILRPSRVNGIWVVLATVLFLNTKTTALVYLPIGFSACALAWFFLPGRVAQWRRMAPLAAWLGCGALVALFFVGYSPYVTNQLHQDNFASPLRNWGAIASFDAQRPPAMNRMNRFERLYFSVFSRTWSGYPSQDPVLKFPFSIHDQEGVYAGSPDTRLGGFGPWFSGALILMVLLVIGKLRSAGGAKSLAWTLGPALAILATTFANPECWWARFVPQLWLLPGLVLISHFLEVRSATRIVRFWGAMLVGVMVFNTILVARSVAVLQWDSTRECREQIKRIPRGSRIAIFFPESLAMTLGYRLRENSITAVNVDDPEKLPCTHPEFLWIRGRHPYCFL